MVEEEGVNAFVIKTSNKGEVLKRADEMNLLTEGEIMLWSKNDSRGLRKMELDYRDHSLVELAKKVNSRELSAEELIKASLKNIEDVDKEINAFVL